MPDVQKTIEILLQIKRAGEEILQQTRDTIEQIGQVASATGEKVDAAFSEDTASQLTSSLVLATSAVGDLKDAAESAGEELKAAFNLPEIGQVGAQLKADQAAAQAFGETAVANFNVATASAESLLYVLRAAEIAESGAGSRSGSVIGGINAAIGRSSELGGFLRLLAGSGPLLAITLVLDRIRSIAQAYEELSAKLKEGSITQDDYVLGIAEEVPVLGTLVAIVADVREAITGEKAAVEASTAAWKKHQEQLKSAYEDRDRFVKAARESSRDVQAFDDQSYHFNDQASAAMLPNGMQKQIAQAWSEYVDRNDQLAKEREASLKRAGATSDIIGGLQKQLNAPFTTSDIAHTIQEKIDAATQAAQDINAAADKAFQASEHLFASSVAGIKIQDAREQTKKIGEALKTDWQDIEKFVAGIRGKVEAQTGEELRKLQEDANRVIAEASTPQQKYNASVSELNRLKDIGLLPPGVYDQALEKFKTTLNDGNAAVAKALADRKIKQDEYDAAVTTGIAKQIADAQTSYDQDVSKWNEALIKKEITQEQFDQFVIERARQRGEQIYQLDLQRRQAGEGVAMAVLQANHDGFGQQQLQIQMEYEQQLEQLRQEYQVQGLISWQQYNDALVALDKSTDERRLLVSGNFFDGLKIGFERMNEGMLSQAQIGAQAANIFGNGFANAFGQIITRAKSVGEAFRDMASSILGDIARLEAQAAFNAVLAPILAGVNATVGAGFSSLFGGASSAAAGLAGAGDPVIVPGGAPAFANAGGFIARFAAGDVVGGGPWGPDEDSVPALLTPGEFVVRRSAVSSPGVLGLLRAINAGMSAHDIARSAAASLGHASSAAAASRASGSSGAAVPTVVPAVVASDSSVREWVNGGRNAMIDFLKTNYHFFAPRGGSR